MDRITTILRENKTKLKVELLHIKKKFIPKNLIEYVIDRKNIYGELYSIILKSKNQEEFYKLLGDYFGKKGKKHVFKDLAFIKSIGLNITADNSITMNICNLVFQNEINAIELKKLLSLYKQELVLFINKNKIFKNRINNLDPEEMEAAEADFTIPFTDKEYDDICRYLFVSPDDYPKSKNKDLSFKIYKTICSNVNVLKDILLMLLSLYDKETLLNEPDFVSFEMNYGYTEKYYELLFNNQQIPSLEERKKIYLKERNISEREQYYLTQLDLLEERIYLLSTPSKELILKKIALIRQEPDINKQAILINEVYEYYEREFRKEIVNSLYSPESSREVKDIDELRPLLLHVFIRDSYKMAENEEESIMEEISSRRGVKVTKVEELTEEEIIEYQSRVRELYDVLLNPVITNKSLKKPSFYSDKDGFRWYKSDTSNQISASLVSYEALMSMGNCIGVGFDRYSIVPESIIISSNRYQTTNMGVDNLEISRNNQFSEKSAPLQELLQSNLTEVVMYRSKDSIETKSAYVFAIISGTDDKMDRETIEKAREYAEKNNIKLIVFNKMLLKQSYEQKYGETKKEL